MEFVSAAIAKYQPHIFTSALSKEGLHPLIEYLKTWKVDPSQKDLHVMA